MGCPGVYENVNIWYVMELAKNTDPNVPVQHMEQTNVIKMERKGVRHVVYS